MNLLELDPVGDSNLSRDSIIRFLRSNTELMNELELEPAGDSHLSIRTAA
jgi:hypothetical protein